MREDEMPRMIRNALAPEPTPTGEAAGGAP